MPNCKFYHVPRNKIRIFFNTKRHLKWILIFCFWFSSWQFVFIFTSNVDSFIVYTKCVYSHGLRGWHPSSSKPINIFQRVDISENSNCQWRRKKNQHFYFWFFFYRTLPKSSVASTCSQLCWQSHHSDSECLYFPHLDFKIIFLWFSRDPRKNKIYWKK